MFVQAALTNPYQILLSTIVRDSGMRVYKTVSERMRQIEKALDELKENKVISEWKSDLQKEKNKILDVLYSLYMSDEFVADAKKANKFTNMRLESPESEVEVYDVDELRREMELPIYRLSKTVINNLIANIGNKEDFDKVSNGLEAAKQYLQTKKIENPAAAVRNAIKEGWLPKKKKDEDLFQQNADIKIIEGAKQAKKLVLKEAQANPIWPKIRKKLESEFDAENWDKWLSKLEIFQIEKKEIIFAAPDKFVRDWVIRLFIEQDSEKKLMKIVQKISPTVEKIKVVVVQE